MDLQIAPRGPDRFEAALLVVVGLLSLWVVGSDVWQTIAHNVVWTHTDGFFTGDQLQYLAWIQSSSRHVLISNLFVLRSTPADYFQPAIILSGLVTHLGVAPWLSLMLWKPVAVVAIFMAVRAAAHHSFDRPIDRRIAMTLGLLFGSLSAVYGSVGVIGDMMPMWQSWGYPFGLIAVALVVFGLLGYARARGGYAPVRGGYARTAGRLRWWPGLLGGLAGTLHPWQGELMILVVAGAELANGRETLRWWRRARAERTRAQLLIDPRVTLPAVTLALVAVPLIYYLGLGRLDSNWGLGRGALSHGFSFSAIAIAAAPLAVFAALGYRGRCDDFFELLIRTWLPAALVLYVLSVTALGGTPLHAVEGLTVPLALLAVKGVRRTGLRRIPHGRLVAWAAVVVGTVPAAVYTIAYAHTYTNPTPGNANFITPSESRAVDYLAGDPTPGGVLTTYYLGAAIPGLTGRPVNVGDCAWSQPRCYPRLTAAEALFGGRLSRPAARRLVRDSGARFVLIGCSPHVGLSRELGALVVSHRRFGCADLYELVSPHPARGPLADADPDRRG